MDFTVDLPDRPTRGRTDWHKVVADCVTNRGMYGLVGEFSTSMASAVRAGQVAAFLPRKGMTFDERREWMNLNWEITSRHTPDNPEGRSNLYVRYVG